MKLACMILMLIISVQMFGQQTTPVAGIDNLQKSKTQKIAAWILLGTGLLSAGLGSVRFQNPDGSYGNSRNTIFTVTGLAAIGGSIPLFVAASRNKTRSMSLSINNQQTYVVINRVVYKLVPTVTLQIN